MRTIRTKIYKFEELSKDAQQTAVNNYRDKNYEIYLDFFNESAKEQIEEAGFKVNIEIQYSLSCSQGDGFSFNADYYDKLNDLFVEILGAGKQKTIDCIINNCSFELKNKNNHYCYASKNDLDFYLDNYYVKSQVNIDFVIDQVREKLESLYMDLCKDLENQGYQEIEWQNSDEYITETIIANEYEFTKDGNLFNS